MYKHVHYQFSHSVVSNSLWSHGLQPTRLSCPSPTLGACSNSCPSRQWCHPTMWSSVTPFSCLQSFPASGSFQMSQLFASGGQSIRVSAQHQSFQWTPRTDFLWDGLVGSPCSPRDSQESSPTPQSKSINSSVLSFLYSPTLTSIHYFANQGPSSQGYGFSSSHVWMRELDYKESRVPKNWCFWTAVLEKTLESPLDYKQIQPVHPKGNQSWIFIGRTDIEAETPIVGHLI